MTLREWPRSPHAARARDRCRHRMATCTTFVRFWQFRDGDQAQISFWSGLRPMTPDGPPVIGKAMYGNLFLNTGRGTLGWTMARGSGRVLADLVSGRKPEIDTSGLGIERYARRRGATPSQPQGAQP